MNLGRLSINQPILAMVLSIVLLIVGAIAYTTLPVAEYPQVVPPTVVVTAQYPGASAQTISDTVAAPIEQQINGVEDMLYLYSQATSNGQLTITITFKLGTDLDKAQVLVQNRVAIAQPQLPEEVQRNGVVTRKNSPDILMVVFMLSPDDTFDQLYISNYALLQVRDQLLRLDGIGDIQIFGARDYSMRLWLDPDKIASLGLTAGDVLAAIRAQNLQITGGQLAGPPIADRAFQPNLVFTGRLKEPAAVRGYPGQGRRRRPYRSAARCGADRTRRARLQHQQLPAAEIRRRHAGHPAPRLQCARHRQAHFRHHGQAQGRLPPRARLQYRLQPDRVHRAIRQRTDQDHLRGDDPRRHRRAGVPAGLAAGDHSDYRDSGVAGRHLRRHGRARLCHQQSDPVRPCAGGRHRGRRRHRRGGKRRAPSARRHEPARCGAEDDGGGRRRAGLDRAGAVRGVRADRVSRRHLRPVLSAVRHHHRGGDGDFLLLLADAVAGAGLADPAAARREAAAGELEFDRARLAEILGWLQPRLRPAVGFLCRRRRLRDPAFGGDAAGLSGADRQRRMAARHHAARLHSGAGPRLRDRFGATARRGLAGAHHRYRPADRADRARHARHHPRRGVRRPVRRDPHPGQQCRGPVPGVRGAGTCG